MATTHRPEEGTVSNDRYSYVFVIEGRIDESEPWEFGTVWSTAQAAIEALEGDAARQNIEDDEAHAAVHVNLLADLDNPREDEELAYSEAYGFTDARVYARRLRVSVAEDAR